MENIITYDWMDILGANKYAESIFKKKKLKLKDLSKIKKYNFLRTNFSKSEISFFLEDILGKISASRVRDFSFGPSYITPELPKEISKYKELIGTNNFEYTEEFYSNLKTGEFFANFEKENLKDLYFKQYIIEGKPAFNIFIVKDMFKEKCNQTFDFYESKPHEYRKFYSLKIISPIKKIAEKVNVLYKISKELDELEEKTGKSFSEIEQIIKFHNNYRNN